MSDTLEIFCRGATAMGFLVAAGFFLRFWRRTPDRLFAFFSAAFALMAFARVLETVLHHPETSPWPYSVRLLAFLVIAVAIVDKNLRRI